jgi:hypothetical protein
MPAISKSHIKANRQLSYGNIIANVEFQIRHKKYLQETSLAPGDGPPARRAGEDKSNTPIPALIAGLPCFIAS